MNRNPLCKLALEILKAFAMPSLLYWSLKHVRDSWGVLHFVTGFIISNSSGTTRLPCMRGCEPYQRGGEKWGANGGLHRVQVSSWLLYYFFLPLVFPSLIGYEITNYNSNSSSLPDRCHVVVVVVVVECSCDEGEASTCGVSLVGRGGAGLILIGLGGSPGCPGSMWSSGYWRDLEHITLSQPLGASDNIAWGKVVCTPCIRYGRYPKML